MRKIILFIILIFAVFFIFLFNINKPKDDKKIVLAEVTHSVFYTPLYVAIDRCSKIECVEQYGGKVKAAAAVDVYGYGIDHEPDTPNLNYLLCQNPCSHYVEHGGKCIKCRYRRVSKEPEYAEYGTPD